MKKPRNEMQRQVLQERDTLLFLSVIVTLAATLKFLGEGVSVTIAKHVIYLGHADAFTYAALLGPVLGAHSYVKRGRNQAAFAAEPESKVDNVDAT